MKPETKTIEKQRRANQQVPKKKRGTCIYCGETGPITRDHVPPQSIFPDPKPANLITVPACEDCNGSFKLDDEYFRTFVVTNSYADEAAKGLWETKIIGSKRAESVRRMLRTASRPVELTTLSGLWIGRRAALSFDAERIARVIGRIVLGLLWHHRRTRHCATIPIKVGMVKGFDGLEEVIAACRHFEIGSGTFRYAYGVPEEDREQSIWFFEFYSSIRFVAFVIRDNSDLDWTITVPRESLKRTGDV